MDRITLRAGAGEDESFLYELYASTRQAEMAVLPWPPEAKDGFLRAQFEAQRNHYRSFYPAADHSIVVIESALAGRLYLDRQASQILIVDLTLLPEFQGRGIGRSLVSSLQEEAASLGKTLTGHVGRWNPASAFWKRMGFDVADGDEMYCGISWSGPSRAPRVPL
jgi:GNAT superfamily N-acetyltransferase